MATSEAGAERSETVDDRGPTLSRAAEGEGDEAIRWDWLRSRARLVAERIGFSPFHLDVIILDDDRITDLNRRFMGVPQTTDVLAFDLREVASDAPHALGVGDHPIDGELYLCIDEARRQAGSRGHPVELELLLYMTHGLLHLSGEDDHDWAAAERMHAREDAILQGIGVGPVYQRGVHERAVDGPAATGSISEVGSGGTG